MDVLSGRKTSGVIEGDVRINGHPKVHATFARVSGYCEQFDIHRQAAHVHARLVQRTGHAFVRRPGQKLARARKPH